MKIMIIGGEGFIGKHLMEAGNAAGHEMVSVDCSGEPTIKKLSTALTIEDISPFDRVIWSAGELGTVETFEHPSYTIEANIVDVVDMLEACKARKTPFTYITLGNNWLNPYTITKNCAAQFCEMYQRIHKVPIQVAVTYNVFGPHQKTFPVRKIVPYFLTQLIEGKEIELFNAGLHWVDMVFAPDLAKAVIANEGTGTSHYYYGTAKPMSVIDILSACEEALSVKCTGVIDKGLRTGETGQGAISPYPMDNITDFKKAMKITADWYGKELGNVGNK